MKICLRPAVESDANMLFDWRNSQTVRKGSLDQHEISFNDHLAWFALSLKLPDRKILIGESHNAPVGVLRFDLGEDTAEVSIYLDPSQTSRGYGKALLIAGLDWAKQNLTGIKVLHAKVKPDNLASIRVFEKTGFTESWRLYTITI